VNRKEEENHGSIATVGGSRTGPRHRSGLDRSQREVLFGEVWERPGLSKRDRSLITCATLIALGREKQLVGHLQRALDNGLTKNELSEVITHLAFYAGWPAAMTAALVAKEVFEKN
jgi:4-carboxymuconolactone decarboxylase